MTFETTMFARLFSRAKSTPKLPKCSRSAGFGMCERIARWIRATHGTRRMRDPPACASRPPQHSVTHR